ncbi:MAG TPA: Hsp20 family protein [Arsenophonus nasoniae]|uniref:Hsp20 family protein n=1 Tax=Arsenophonus nasoniae TaxID=638 RepID=UPI00387A2FD8
MAYRSFSLIPMLSDNLLSDRFTQMDKLFSRITGEKPLSDMPTYNLYQKDKENLELTVAVPGYKQNELDISVLNNKLIISGKSETEKEENNHDSKTEKWLHKGIEKKGFSMNFDLDHRIKIQNANLADGLLTLTFNYEIPEEEKPQKIAIGQTSQPEVIEHKK